MQMPYCHSHNILILHIKAKHDDGETEDFKMEFSDDQDKILSQKSDADSGFSSAASQNVSSDDMKKDAGDALSALASAALDHSKDFKTDNSISDGTAKDDKDVWYTVGFIKGNSYDVQHYYHLEGDTSSFTINDLPDMVHLNRINLDPGTAYRFRVAAINSVGRGEWSEVK